MKETDTAVRWFNTQFYPTNRTCRAARYEDGVLPRLREQEIILFTPWGPRYSWKKRGTVIRDSDKEIEVIGLLAEIWQKLSSNMPGKNLRWVFLGADLYGTRINNLPVEVVEQYFDSLRELTQATIPGSEFLVWSNLDRQAELFRQKARLELYRLISSGERARAERTARAMGSGSATPYLVERLAEAMLIEQMFKPVKVSCVGRHKDNEVDWQLPRLYFVPEHLQAPWL